jgi:hypothetical protein
MSHAHGIPGGFGEPSVAGPEEQQLVDEVTQHFMVKWNLASFLYNDDYVTFRFEEQLRLISVATFLSITLSAT